jgi:hypothetical protein
MTTAATTLEIRRALAEPAAGDPQLDALADSVVEIAGLPVDVWAVAATLESRGVRDVDAVKRYGHRDVFDLADDVYELCLRRAPEPEPEVVERPSGRAAAGTLAKRMARGAFFFVPLGLQIVALVLFGYSQWASVHFNGAQASVIGMAAALSFIVTGGFVQGLGYLGPQFREPGKFRLAERVTWSTLAFGMAGALLFGGLLFCVQAAVSAYPAGLFRVGLVYYVLMATLWLANAALYMLRHYVAMVVATVVGIAAVVALHGGAGLGIYASQWLGLGTSVVISLGWVGVVLHRQAAATRGDLRLARLPPRAALVRAVAPFFAWGALYFLLLLSDRFVGWSVGNFALPVWFRVPYELGLDWALVAVVASLAFLEQTVEEFAARIVPLEERVPARDARRLHLELTRFYVRNLAACLGLAVAGIAVAWLVLRGLAADGGLGAVGKQVRGAVTPAVFGWGALGYALLAWGLLNATFLFSLMRPWHVAKAIAVAVVVDVGVGLWLSRSGPYWHSVIGLACGAAVFAGVTTVLTLRALRRADYLYFAAY